jgi:hypothetical protein
MRTDILVSLLISRVFRDKVKVLPSDHDRSVHLCAHDHSRQDSPTNGHARRGKRTFLVNVGAFDRLDGGLEAEADFTVPALGRVGLFGSLLGDGLLLVLEDALLVLESLFGLLIHDLYSGWGLG